MTPTSDALLSLFVRAELDAAPAFVRSWSDEASRRANLEASLRDDVSSIFDSALKAKFHERAALPGTTPSDFGPRVLTLEDGSSVLASVRFRGGDLARPFVNVVASTRRPSTGDLSGMTAEIAAHFSVFAPPFVRLFVPDDVGLVDLPPGSHLDRSLVAAPLHDLRAKAPPHLDRVVLPRASDLGFYERYAREYARLAELDPFFPEFAEVEDRDDLRDCLEAGGLFEVLVDGAWSGVVAVERGVKQGLSGFVVREMLMVEMRRGRGLGAAVQRRLADALPNEPGDVLMGTIHAENRAALRAAQSAGRHVVGTWVFVNASPRA